MVNLFLPDHFLSPLFILFFEKKWRLHPAFRAYNTRYIAFWFYVQTSSSFWWLTKVGSDHFKKYSFLSLFYILRWLWKGIHTNHSVLKKKIHNQRKLLGLFQYLWIFFSIILKCRFWGPSSPSTLFFKKRETLISSNQILNFENNFFLKFTVHHHQQQTSKS